MEVVTAVEIMQMEFDKRKMANKNYSLRSYARNLGLSPGYLSQVLNKKKDLTPKVLCAIASRLNLSAEKLEKLLKIQSEVSKQKQLLNSQKELVKNIDMETFSVISDWYHYAILHVFQLEKYKDTPEWIARKLSISIEEASGALERLLDVKLIEKNKQGKLVVTNNYVGIQDYEFSSIAMRERQKQILRLSAEKIDLQSISIRDHSAITVAVDPVLLPEIKERIKKFRRSLGKYIVNNSNKTTSVYELQISFFSVTDD